MSYETAVRVLVSFLEGTDRTQVSLLPPCIDDYVAPESLVRVVDAFVGSLDLAELGFARTVAAATGRPGYHPGDMLRLYVWGYLNQVRSSRHLERACIRDLEALWLMKQLAPDYRTIAAFRHDNPEAIVAASAAFIQFCLDGGLITGRMVALDGTKMRAVASPKNIAGAERLARDVAHTEKEIAYYLDRLDAMDEAVTQGFDDQPVHRQAFTDAIAALSRRKDRLARRQEILVERAEKVLVIDCDVHQGDGTAALLAGDAGSFTLSLHAASNYPFTKQASDLDVPLADRTGDRDYLRALEEALAQAFARFRPELAIYVAGADAYDRDRLGKLSLSKKGLARRDRRVFEACRERGVPVALTMGGGYADPIEDTVDIYFATLREAWRAGRRARPDAGPARRAPAGKSISPVA